MNVENGMIQLSISNRQLEHIIRYVHSMYGKFPLAIARAANRTMYGMGIDVARETSKRYFVNVGAVKKTIKYRKATGNNLIGRMISRDKRHSLANYKLSPNTPRAGTKPALKGAVKREGGLKSLGPAFLVKKAGGRYFPFYRIASGSGNKNKGIQSLISPSMPQIIKNEETVEAMQQSAEERFSKRVEHEIFHIIDELTR